MDEVKEFYYEQLDCLESIKKSDTNSKKQNEYASEISSTDMARTTALLTLQNEFDSL